MPNYINVPVPEHLVPAVIALISEQMKPTPSPAAAPAPTAALVATVSSEWSEAEFKKLWDESWQPMRTVLTKLAENGGKAVSGDELAKVIGKEKKGHSIAGMMGALGRRIKHRHNGRWPFNGHWNAELYRWEYVMPLANAEHILKFVPAKNVP